MIFTDDTIMPTGKYKGEKLANVPADYLIYIYDNGCWDGDLKRYILDNMDALKQEVK